MSSWGDQDNSQVDEVVAKFKVNIEVMHTNHYGEGNEDTETMWVEVERMKDGSWRGIVGNLFHSTAFAGDTCEDVLRTVTNLKTCQRENCSKHKREAA